MFYRRKWVSAGALNESVWLTAATAVRVTTRGERRIVLLCSLTFLIVRWHFSCRIFPRMMGTWAKFFFTMAVGGEHLLFLLSLAPLPAILLEYGSESGLLESNWGKIRSLLGRALTTRKSSKNMEASLVMTEFEVPTLKSKLGAVNPKRPEMSCLKFKNQLH